MTKPTSKEIIITVVAAVMGGAIGAGATYQLVDRTDSLESLARSSGPQSGDAPVVPGAEQGDTNLPEGTIDPKSISLEPQKYTEKEVKVRGRVVEYSPGQYSIVSQDNNNPASLRIDFSKSQIDPKTYAAPVGGSKVENTDQRPPGVDPVTVTGNLVKSEVGGGLTYTFFVSSIDK